MENEILNKILEGQNEIKGAVEKLENNQNEIKNTVKQLQNNQNKMQEDLSELKDKVSDIDRVVMKIEHEHGDKIQALLDAVVVNNEKYQEIKKEHEERFSNISFKLLSNDVRLDKLEKVVNK